MKSEGSHGLHTARRSGIRPLCYQDACPWAPYTSAACLLASRQNLRTDLSSICHSAARNPPPSNSAHSTAHHAKARTHRHNQYISHILAPLFATGPVRFLFLYTRYLKRGNGKGKEKHRARPCGMLLGFAFPALTTSDPKMRRIEGEYEEDDEDGWEEKSQRLALAMLTLEAPGSLCTKASIEAGESCPTGRAAATPSL